MLDRFRSEHARAYAFEERGRKVEIYSLRVVARGVVPRPRPAPAGQGASTLPKADKTRSLHLGKQHGFVETPVLRRDALEPGMVIEGPMVVEQLDSTVVLPPGTRSEVTADRHIVMRFT